MKHLQATLTKKELSLTYFPADNPANGWRKIKSYLSDETSLQRLFRSQRQTIYPAELQTIFRHLGEPV